MGGNAIRNHGINSRRVGTTEYREICQEITEKIQKEGTYKQILLVPSYRNKTDFGDADFVVLSENVNPKEVIQNLFTPNVIVKNSNIFSFDFKNFQIDFIFHSNAVFQTAFDYYSYSPYGNACGKIIHKFGLRYGHDGLRYTIREELFSSNKENSHIINNPIICSDTEKIHRFLKLDHFKWKNGFENQEDIFESICSSGYFNADIFSLENMNHIARTRDRKRPDYNLLLKYIEKNKNSLGSHNFLKKENYLEYICSEFPILKKEIENCREFYNKKILIKSKFNGKIIKDWTNLEGKELGMRIEKFKKSFVSNEEFENFIIDSDPKTVKLYFENL